MLLDVIDVSKRFGGLQVIHDFSFQLAEGEALGIVGPNGAGKTTLLSLVSGDHRSDRGRVMLDGVDIARMPAHQRCRMGIGRTAQIPRPFEGLTVFENVLVGSTFGSADRLRGATPEAAAVTAIEQAGMIDKANVVAGSLTLLERKRLELARALSTKPKVLLLDEIAGGLTEAEVLELVEVIRGIRSQGVAIVWIEHIMHALLRVVDRMMAVDDGRKLIEGDPHEVMTSNEVRSVYLGDDLEGGD
ncbi:MAG: ABC transporter ATP-binding protein [Acidobacteria bacterium]|nr:ABC transporter ATP-binding protein [Acidobacteriota bacterium]